MNPSLMNAQTLTQKLVENLEQNHIESTILSFCKLAIAPTTLHILAIEHILKQSSAQIQLASQDTAIARHTGAFTGDISADLL